MSDDIATRVTVEDLIRAMRDIPDHEPRGPLIFFATPAVFANDAAVDYILGLYGCTTVWKQEPIPLSKEG